MADNVDRECIQCDGGCGKSNPRNRCSRCRTTYYCGVECQRKHWREEHKNYCFAIEQMREKLFSDIGPVLTFSSAPEGINSSCPICMDEPINEPVIVLERCRHAFCSHCLMAWQNHSNDSSIASHETSSGQNRCPMCRMESEDLTQVALDNANFFIARAQKRTAAPEESAEYIRMARYEVKKLIEAGIDHLNLNTFYALAAVLRDMADKESFDLFPTVLERLESDAQIARTEMASIVADGEIPVVVTRNMKNLYFQIQLLLGEFYNAKGDWTNATEAFKDILNQLDQSSGRPPLWRRVWAGLCTSQYCLGNYDRAITAADAAILMNRHFPGVHRQMAQAQKAQGELEAAVRTMNQAVLYETPWDDENRRTVLEFYEELKTELRSQSS